MPTKKSPSKKSSGKSAAAGIRSGAVPPYGDPIREAVSRGNAAEMKAVAAAARKHLKDVTAALAKLDAAMGMR